VRLFDRLDRLDQRLGVRPTHVRLSQRELWREVLTPPLLWWLLAAIAVTVAVAAWTPALMIAIGPVLVLPVLAEGARRLRRTNASEPTGTDTEPDTS
jgi:hypothetical protein